MGCHPQGPSAADFMGFSVRAVGWRYTEWLRYNKTAGVVAWDQLYAAELYDHREDQGDDFDSFENENVVERAENEGTRARLSEVLRGHFQHDRGQR